jgi:hypothetical protein
MTSHENLLAQIDTLLDGIDRDECHPDGGWWQTSDGSKFGRIKLRELKELISTSLPAARAEPEGVTDKEKWYPGFADWLEREMPEGAVIGDPLWWASKIADYLQRFARPTIEPVPSPEIVEMVNKLHQINNPTTHCRCPVPGAEVE